MMRRLGVTVHLGVRSPASDDPTACYTTAVASFCTTRFSLLLGRKCLKRPNGDASCLLTAGNRLLFTNACGFFNPSAITWRHLAASVVR